jgi:hypothetical protein
VANRTDKNKKKREKKDNRPKGTGEIMTESRYVIKTEREEIDGVSSEEEEDEEEYKRGSFTFARKFPVVHLRCPLFAVRKTGPSFDPIFRLPASNFRIIYSRIIICTLFSRRVPPCETREPPQEPLQS